MKTSQGESNSKPRWLMALALVTEILALVWRAQYRDQGRLGDRERTLVDL